MIRFPIALTASAALAFAVVTGACGNGADAKPSATAGALETRAPTAPPSPTATAPIAPTSTVPATATASPTAATAATVAASPTAVPQPPAPTQAPQPTPVPRAAAVSLTVRANNLAFDKTSLRVPAGATVTATLQNDDTGVPHNLTFSLPGLAHGETCAGPCTRTQTFTPASAGSYFFLCTLHDMSGTFVVEP